MMEDINVNETVTADSIKPKKENKKKPIQTIISDSVLVKVKSGFYGKLYYKNLTTGESTSWERAGDVQIMSMRDLRAMRAQQTAFFKNQWVVIIGVADGEDCSATPEEICRSLIVSQYYENFIDPCDFSSACSWSVNEIQERVQLMSAGAKENLAIAVNGYIARGELDSIRRIKAFEQALDCSLMDIN